MIADAVRIQVLGCGDAFNSGGRLHACYLVTSPSATFLVDCGPTVLVAMRSQGVAPDGLDAIFISHLHADHMGGVPFVLLELGLIVRRERELVIAGPRGIEERITRALELFFPGTPLDGLPVRYVELEPHAPASVAGARATAYPVLHVPETNPQALRMEVDGRTIGYSGDTEWTDELVRVADGADVFLCECSTFEREVPGHLSARTLAAKRGELRAGRVVLMHMGEDVLRQLPLDGFEAAEDGMRITV